MNGAWVYSIITFLYCIFHLIALTLSLVFWRRCPKVCALVLAGGVLNLLAMGSRLFLPAFFFRDQDTFALISLGIGVVNICGSSFYLAAIFTGADPVHGMDRDSTRLTTTTTTIGIPPHL